MSLLRLEPRLEEWCGPDPSEWTLLLRLTAAYTLLRACLDGPLDVDSEHLWRCLVSTFDCHYPQDGLGAVVGDLYPRLLNRALSGT